MKGAEATPDAFVVTVIVAVLLLNVPEAPDDGAVNVTLTPCTGLAFESFTVTASGFVNAAPALALCGVVPAFAVIDEQPALKVREDTALSTTAFALLATQMLLLLKVAEAVPVD